MKKNTKSLHRRTIKGIVLSSKPKTITVIVNTKKQHPIYKKRIKSSKKYYAHDEKNLAKVNDNVIIEEYRPMSALKRYRLLKIIENKNMQKKQKNIKKGDD